MLFIISQPDEISRFKINPNTDIVLCVKSNDMLQVCDLKSKFRNLYLLDLFEFTGGLLDQHIVEQLHDCILKLRTEGITTYDLDSEGLSGAVAHAVTVLALNFRSINPILHYINSYGCEVTYTESEIDQRLFTHYYGDSIPLIDQKYFNGVSNEILS
jgi:hypothetical protein